MYLRKRIPLALVFLLVIGLSSCVKDIDFDQAGDITMQPEINASILIFEIDQRDFVDPETKIERLIIRDTVRLDFLDDDYIQKDLEKVEFSFKYKNTFPQAFSNRILFLSENNRLQHEIAFDTDPGQQGRPVVTEKIEIIGPDKIQVIKRSIKMVVEIKVIPNGQPFMGELNFESKGLFSFQF